MHTTFTTIDANVLGHLIGVVQEHGKPIEHPGIGRGFGHGNMYWEPGFPAALRICAHDARTQTIICDEQNMMLARMHFASKAELQAEVKALEAKVAQFCKQLQKVSTFAADNTEIVSADQAAEWNALETETNRLLSLSQK